MRNTINSEEVYVNDGRLDGEILIDDFNGANTMNYRPKNTIPQVEVDWLKPFKSSYFILSARKRGMNSGTLKFAFDIEYESALYFKRY